VISRRNKKIIQYSSNWIKNKKGRKDRNNEGKQENKNELKKKNESKEKKV
jgi:hypothetical protein